MKHILITLFTIVLIACGGAEERKSAYLEKARISMEAGDLDKARIELKNVLQIDPKDAAAYFQLGSIFEQKKDYRKAFGNYSKAVELSPDNLEYHAKVGSYHLIFAGDIDIAIEKRDFILGVDEKNVSGLLLKAGILVKQKDTAGAMKITKDIFSNQPGHIENAVFLSSLYLNDKNYDASINTLKACIKENPENISLLNALASSYEKAEKYDLAEDEYKLILKIKPDVLSNYLKLALFYKERGDFDKAENILRKSIEQDEDDDKRKLALVEIIQQMKGNQAAIVELKSLIESNKNMGELRLSLAKIYVVENKLDDAERMFKSTISDFPEDSVGIKSRVYLANLYMQREDVDAATSVVDDGLAISPNDSEVNFIKAKLLLVSKDYERALISLRTVIKEDPENIEAYFLMSAAHKVKGEEKQAREIIGRAFENNRSNTKGLTILANYYAKNKNMDELERVVDSYILIDPNNYDVLTYKSMLLNEKKMYSEASVIASQLIKLNPDKPNGYIQSIPYMMSLKKQDEAISLLEDGYEHVEDNSRILEMLVTIHASTKDFDKAAAVVKSAIKERGETAELYLLLAKVQLASSKSEEAKTNLTKAIAIKPDWNEPYLNLANIYVASKQFQKAVDILRQGLARVENDLKLLLGLARLYEGLGKYDAAITEYEKAYVSYSDNTILVNNLAALLSEHRSDESSLKRAKELADKLKKAEQPVILDTVGWVYYKTGDYAEAVTVLKTVVEKSPDVPVFNYHLGMALSRVGDDASARTYLSKALDSNSNFPGKDEANAQMKKLQ